MDIQIRKLDDGYTVTIVPDKVGLVDVTEWYQSEISIQKGVELTWKLFYDANCITDPRELVNGSLWVNTPDNN